MNSTAFDVQTERATHERHDSRWNWGQVKNHPGVEALLSNAPRHGRDVSHWMITLRKRKNDAEYYVLDIRIPEEWVNIATPVENEARAWQNVRFSIPANWLDEPIRQLEQVHS